MERFSHPLDRALDDDSDFEHEFPDNFPQKQKFYDSPSPTRSTSSQSSVSSKNKYLYPVTDVIEPLRPEEVRWFYWLNESKKWKPFIGYDSLRIECKYREITHNKKKQKEDYSQKDEKICVRGSLYEVSVLQKTCFPIYWHHKDETAEIMRGTWFMDSTWLPLEENICEEIEREHLLKFEGEVMDEMKKPESGKSALPVLHTLPFDEFYIEWNANALVSLHYEKTSSKLYRAIGRGLGLSSNVGTRIRRGYFTQARIDDKIQDIGHLVFVIHGIGQKMETSNIVKRCSELREHMSRMHEKHVKVEEDDTRKRAEFLPVEWRSNLKLDGDIVDSITPAKLLSIRSMLNASAMDILYYTSPLYRSEIIQGLQRELNRLYAMFCERHPYFEASNGKVSVIAHSLGAVITYDIITGWSPVELYDQYVSRLIGQVDPSVDEVKDATGAELGSAADSLLSQLEQARKNVSDLEKRLFSLAEKRHIKIPNLKFTPVNFFCLGSPLAVFLALRGVRPTTTGSQEHILPRTLCSRLFNIYHPYDPVAYRLEPLLLKSYGTIAPLRIFRHDHTKRVPYDTIPPVALARVQTKSGSKGDAKKARDAGGPPIDVTPETNNNRDEADGARRGKGATAKAPSPDKKESGGSLLSWFSRRRCVTTVISELSSMETSSPSSSASSQTSTSSPAGSPSKSRATLRDPRDHKDGGSGGTESDSEGLAELELGALGAPPPDSPVAKLFTDLGLLADDKSEAVLFELPDYTELEHRVDFQLHEGRMENAYWSALTSHTSYWTNDDVALFVLQQLFPQLELT